MQISSVQQDQVTIFIIEGKFDATTSKEADAYLQDTINDTHCHLVLDLSQVSYLSSAGVRVMLAAMQDARKAGGDLRLAVPSGNIRKVIEIAGFSKIMKIFDTLDEAAESYNS